MHKLTERERVEVEHWRRWCAQGGANLTYAPQAIQPLIAIIDRLLTLPSTEREGGK